MSYLGTRNAVALGVSQHMTLGGSNLLETLSPSLLLQFVGAETLDPRITFTRSTTATFTGSDGLIQTAAINAPRFDYNPTTLASLGLLIEEQRTNLLLYSEQFDNAVWTKSNATITANTIIAPDGALTGDKLVEDTATSTHVILAGLASPTASTTYTGTVYIKAAERQFAFVGFNGGGLVSFASINLSTGVVSVAVGTPTVAATSVGNGWYRVSVTATTTSTAFLGFDIRISTDGVWANRSYTGDGVSGIFIWGAQLEAGAFATSYIPTVASQVTRAADVAVMTGTNFSDWYNAPEGTFFSSIVLDRTPAQASGSVIYTVTDGTNSNRVLTACGSGAGGNLNALVTTGGVLQAQTINGGLSAVGAYKYANTYKLDDFASVANGGTFVTDTSGTVPTVNRMNLGANAAGGTNFNSCIRQIAYYPRRLTDAELQAITS